MGEATADRAIAATQAILLARALIHALDPELRSNVAEREVSAVPDPSQARVRARAHHLAAERVEATLARHQLQDPVHPRVEEREVTQHLDPHRLDVLDQKAIAARAARHAAAKDPGAFPAHLPETVVSHALDLRLLAVEGLRAMTLAPGRGHRPDAGAPAVRQNRGSSHLDVGTRARPKHLLPLPLARSLSQTARTRILWSTSTLLVVV